MKGQVCFNAVASSVGFMRSAGLSLLVFSVCLYIADSYPDFNMGCEECALRRNDFFSREQPIFQCVGCCFSRAYPTPFGVVESMAAPKNITSEATCCVAKNSSETEVAGIRVRNHTECHCHTCYHHTI